MMIFSLACMSEFADFRHRKKNIDMSQFFCDENCVKQFSKNIVWLSEMYPLSGRRTPYPYTSYFN